MTAKAKWAKQTTAFIVIPSYLHLQGYKTWNVARIRVNVSLLHTVKNACGYAAFLSLPLCLSVSLCSWSSLLCLAWNWSSRWLLFLDNVLCECGAQFRQWRRCNPPPTKNKQGTITGKCQTESQPIIPPKKRKKEKEILCMTGEMHPQQIHSTKQQLRTAAPSASR